MHSSSNSNSNNVTCSGMSALFIILIIRYTTQCNDDTQIISITYTYIVTENNEFEVLRKKK